jgi:hypothetical protein
MDACNPPTASAPNLGAGRTRRPRDLHLSHARLRPPRFSPLRARPRARPIWAGARGTLTRRLGDPPVLKRRQSVSERTTSPRRNSSPPLQFAPVLTAGTPAKASANSSWCWFCARGCCRRRRDSRTRELLAVVIASSHLRLSPRPESSLRQFTVWTPSLYLHPPLSCVASSWASDLGIRAVGGSRRRWRHRGRGAPPCLFTGGETKEECGAFCAVDRGINGPI